MGRSIGFLFLFSFSLFSQPSNIKISATSTSAYISYTPSSSSTCTVDASEEEDLDPPVNDVNTDLFSGANEDSRFSAYHTSVRRVFILGQKISEKSGTKIYSRALPARTKIYLSITCDGSSVETNFVTAEISGLSPSDNNFLSDGWGFYGDPTFDWGDRTKGIVDPLTGAKIHSVWIPEDTGFLAYYNFPAYFGGSGWSDLSNIISGVIGTLATTNNTNSVFVPFNFTSSTVRAGFYRESWPALSAVGVQIYGSGTDGTATNREIDICMSVDSGQSCFTDTIRITLPQTTPADQGIFPTDFPTAGFTGWSEVLPANYWTTEGYVDVSGTTVTLIEDYNGTTIGQNPESSASYFRPEWVAGTKIYIAGSDPTCPDNYCTLASYTDRLNIEISESLSLSDVNYKSAASGIMIAKTNNTGSVSLSSRYRVAAYLTHTPGQAENCSPLTVTTNVDRDGNPIATPIEGRLCIINQARDKLGMLYFVGTKTPEFRVLSANIPPSSIPGHDPNDQPTGNPFRQVAYGNAFFSQTDADVYYINQPTPIGTSIFKVTYSGDYRENSTLSWSYSTIGSWSYTDVVTWENMFRGAGNDPRSQILANTSYDESKWGSLTSGLSFAGIVDNYIVYYKLLQSQDLPCAVFTFDATTTPAATFATWLDTITNSSGGGAPMGCHSIIPYGDKIYISSYVMTRFNSSYLWGGPFVAPIDFIYKSGSWDADTSLPTLYDGSYDGACPSDIPQKWKDLGATGNNCVKIRVTTQPCSDYAGANEKTWTPCPSDSNKSYIGRNVAVGDTFQDYQKSYNPGSDNDSERFTVVKVENNSPYIDYTMLRDSATGYACQSADPRGRICVAIPSQSEHTDGWSLAMRGFTTATLINPQTGEITAENEGIHRGHFDISFTEPDLNTYTGIATTTSGDSYASRLLQTEYAAGAYTLFAYNPPWVGTTLNGGYTQSYLTVPSLTAESEIERISSDWRHLNSPFGAGWEIPVNLGSTMTYTLQGGTSFVYKVSPVSGTLTSYKNQKIVGWYGYNILDEKSGPSVTLSDSDIGKFCRALQNDECFSGSTAGDVYVVVPYLETTYTQCRSSQVTYNSLCLFVENSQQTQIMQIRIGEADLAAWFQRSIGTGMVRPAAQYVYTKARMLGTAYPTILTSMFHNQGWGTFATWLNPGSFSTSSLNPAEYKKIEVNIPSGLITDRAVVKFWYWEKGYCTDRTEDCYAASSTIDNSDPFLYGHEITGSDGVSCASGCTISIPAKPNNLVFYEIFNNSSGVLTSVSAKKIIKP